MIDIGVNLLHRQFDDDRDQVLARARAAGVSSMLVTATDLATSHQALAFCAEHDLYCTAGIHPHDAKGAPDGYADELRRLGAHREVRAIGETGLDFNRNFSAPDIQQQVFATQLQIAVDLNKPVFVHDRDSNGAVFDTLRRFADRLPGVVVHCFTGTRRDLESYLGAGFYIGITGWVCDIRRGAELRELVASIPLERLLLETDAPFLLPHSVADWPPADVPARHKRRNEPMLLPLVVKQVAELYQLPVGRIIDITSSNARRLFQLPQPA